MFLRPVRSQYKYQPNTDSKAKGNSSYSNNTLVFYKNNSLGSNKSGTVVNSRAVARRT